MTKYEYKIHNQDYIKNHVDKEGKEGWKLVAIFANSVTGTFNWIFIRPIE